MLWCQKVSQAPNSLETQKGLVLPRGSRYTDKCRGSTKDGHPVQYFDIQLVIAGEQAGGFLGHGRTNFRS